MGYNTYNTAFIVNQAELSNLALQPLILSLPDVQAADVAMLTDMARSVLRHAVPA